jgi:hypothetical protein
MGAKLGGKSRSVTSLIARIQGQVGSGFSASLMPVTPETQVRRGSLHSDLFQHIRERIPGSVPMPLDPQTHPKTVPEDIMRELENGRVIPQGSVLSVPVAIVLAKSDPLRDFGLVEPNRRWSTEAGHVGHFGRRLQDDGSGMMGELLYAWSQPAYNDVRTRFPRHAFLGVSSTGCASDKATRRFQFVSPWRVEDPLIWFPAELRAIPERGRDPVSGATRRS